jgi:hypothetical protein
MKYLGTFLVIIGISIIFYAMFFSMQIFMQEKEPPEIFKANEISFNQLMQKEETEENTELDGVNVEDVFPVNLFFNIFAAGIFTGILILGGAKIAGIGVGILKERENYRLYE